MKGLVVDEPWIGYLLDGTKTWEMRPQPTAHRGWVALIAKGTGTVVGVGRLVGVGSALDENGMIAAIPKHRIPEAMIRSGAVAKWTVPWIFEDVAPIARPVPYRHPSGAVTWVILDEAVSEEVERQMDSDGGADAERTSAATATSPSPTIFRAASPASPAPPALAVGTRAGRIIGRSEIMQGSLKQGYLRVAEVLHALPADAVGGSNEGEAGLPILIDWGGGSPLSTEIAGDKKILRIRGWKEFYRRSGAEVGDNVVFAETGHRTYRIWVERS